MNDLFMRVEPTLQEPDASIIRHLDIMGTWCHASSMWTYDKRELREVANRNTCIISGNKGYCLDKYATLEERKDCADRLISQGREMTRRGIRIMRKAHTDL
jgi:hypothetical protein